MNNWNYILGELDEATLRAQKASEEAALLQKQLNDSHRKTKDKSDENTTLQGETTSYFVRLVDGLVVETYGEVFIT